MDVLYWLGEALAAGGKPDAARDAWRQAPAEGKDSDVAVRLYRALAMRRLGQSRQAERILDGLAGSAAKPKPGAYDLYIAGLAERARHHEASARADFKRAIEADPSFWLARLELSSI